MIMKVPRIARASTKRLKAMLVGDSYVFLEPAGTKNAGAPSQSYASRAGVKITTTSCLVVVPSSAAVVKAVIVTRIG